MRSKKINIGNYTLLLATIVIGLFMGMKNNQFFQLSNMLEILKTASIVGLMSLGVLFPSATGEIDFSIGAQLSLAAVVVGRLMDAGFAGNNYLVCALIAIAASALMGFVNSVLIVRIKMPSFVATYGLAMTVEGILIYFTNNTYYFSSNWTPAFTAIGHNTLAGIPIAAIIFVVLGFIVWIFVDRTRTGRYIFAVGSNANACNNVGIRITKEKTIAFVLCGVLCGIAGIINSSIAGNVTATMGSDNLMNAMAALYLGATFWKPGVFNVPGCFIAAVLMAVISNGLVMIGASFFMRNVILGAILIIAVGIIAVIRKEALPEVAM